MLPFVLLVAAGAFAAGMFGYSKITGKEENFKILLIIAVLLLIFIMLR